MHALISLPLSMPVPFWFAKEYFPPGILCEGNELVGAVSASGVRCFKDEVVPGFPSGTPTRLE